MAKTEGKFWKSCEEVYDEVLNRPGLASMTNEMTGSREAMLAGLQALVHGGDLISARAATRLFDVKPGVH